MAAFTIHTSQKTLTVSYLVWAGYFAAKFPMAFIPAIAYHLTQMVMDTFVAHWFRRKSETTKLDMQVKKLKTMNGRLFNGQPHGGKCQQKLLLALK